MSATNSENELLAAVEQLTNLVAVAITRGMKQPEAIELLGRASLSNEQIAEVLDTTTGTVRATRSRIERAAKPAAKKGSGNGTPAE